MFEIEYSNQSLSFLKKIDKQLADRILEKIEKLRENPVIHDTKTIAGYKEKLFRVRVGKCRILYEVDHKTKKIGIVNIDKRDRDYD